MAPDLKGSRIVDQWAGEGTGDVIYRTADGRTWVTTTSRAVGTGETLGRVVGDRVATEKPTAGGEETGR